MPEPKYVVPSIDETAFNCPHCGALTTQRWYDLRARPVDGEQRTPLRLVGAIIDESQFEGFKTEEARTAAREWFGAMSGGAPFLEKGVINSSPVMHQI